MNDQVKKQSNITGKSMRNTGEHGMHGMNKITLIKDPEKQMNKVHISI